MKQAVIILAVTFGLLAGCSPSVETASNKFNELPPAVQKTVRAQAPDSEIANVTNTKRNGQQAYEITFRQANGNPRIVVAADGTLLSSELGRTAGTLEKMLTPTGATGTEYSALPEPVQKTIQSKAPSTEIAKITRHESNGRMIYEVEFKDSGKNPTIRVAQDGTLVQDLQK